ncbi:uncharacterized protein LOC107274247 isoform X2 [Cephus cinctus]|uniref:Uncharacterized protein LOC107274247 isoform X2 n=1 Tax=Cephus cinctus TaxID=211228 RepID=A0AAJ7RV49_CEPCN|nr:uncharacterized protein LOC107274247 isoform X2 [Cephus cinctus]
MCLGGRAAAPRRRRRWWWCWWFRSRRMMSWFTVVQMVGMIGILAMLRVAEGCPSMCACKWKSGKEWVECANRKLKTVPQGAREETQVLDLSENQLFELTSESFLVLGLTNLQKLYLGRSKISKISERAFLGLVGLVELDLSGNLIHAVPSETFTSYPGLMRLILNDNPIRTIARDAFAPLGHLTNLELSHCQLELIESGAFAGLHSLEWLRLDGNILERVPEGTLPLGGNLHGLSLHNNTWFCDCRLRPLHVWLKESLANVPQETEPICHSPGRLHGRQIKSVKFGELACLPQITLKEHLEAYEASNLSIHCNVAAIPAARITWLFNGEPCEPRIENYSLPGSATSSTTSFQRYVHRQRGIENATSTLLVQTLEPTDEGTYSCVADNAAGIVEANLSLRVLLREKVTIEPPLDQPSTGYVAAVAAGALVGTLLALGCIVGGVFLCTKRRRDCKRNASKPLVSQSKVIAPIVKERKKSMNLFDQRNHLHQQHQVEQKEHHHHYHHHHHHQQQQQQRQQQQQEEEHQQDQQHQVNTTERSRKPMNNQTLHVAYPRVNLLDSRRDSFEATYGDVSASKYSTEPDLINEVTESNDGGYEAAAYRQQLADACSVLDGYESARSTPPFTVQPELRSSHLQHLHPHPHLRPHPHMSCLDQDGYPLNFGLPKVPPFNNVSTLPRPRQRTSLEGMAAVPVDRYCREAEFLARSPPYAVCVPRPDARYTAEGYPYSATHPVQYPRQGLKFHHHHHHQQHHNNYTYQQHQFRYQESSLKLQVAPVNTSSTTNTKITMATPEPSAFIPSPPAAYRGESSPASPRSFLDKSGNSSVTEAAPITMTTASASGSASGTSTLTSVSTIGPVVSAALRLNGDVVAAEHTESPDEGYVGDAMDV